jgi:hypothetical protein
MLNIIFTKLRGYLGERGLIKCDLYVELVTPLESSMSSKSKWKKRPELFSKHTFYFEGVAEASQIYLRDA